MFNIKNQQFTLGQPKWKQGSVTSEDDERTQRRRYMATGSRITGCSDGRTDGRTLRCLSLFEYLFFQFGIRVCFRFSSIRFGEPELFVPRQLKA